MKEKEKKKQRQREREKKSGGKSLSSTFCEVEIPLNSNFWAKVKQKVWFSFFLAVLQFIISDNNLLSLQKNWIFSCSEVFCTKAGTKQLKPGKQLCRYLGSYEYLG